jgi:predicted peroxiredoxin
MYHPVQLLYANKIKFQKLSLLQKHWKDARHAGVSKLACVPSMITKLIVKKKERWANILEKLVASTGYPKAACVIEVHPKVSF